MTRRRRPVAQWAALIDEWQDGGLSLPAFCEGRGLNPGTMQGWVNRRGHRLAIEQVRPQAHDEKFVVAQSERCSIKRSTSRLRAHPDSTAASSTC